MFDKDSARYCLQAVRIQTKTAAYASQHTDDAKYGHPLNFENGGRFHRGLSAHRFPVLQELLSPRGVVCG